MSNLFVVHSFHSQKCKFTPWASVPLGKKQMNLEELRQAIEKRVKEIKDWSPNTSNKRKPDNVLTARIDIEQLEFSAIVAKKLKKITKQAISRGQGLLFVELLELRRQLFPNISDFLQANPFTVSLSEDNSVVLMNFNETLIRQTELGTVSQPKLKIIK